MKEAINLLRPPLRFHNQQRGVANPLQYETITLCDGDEDDSDERKPAAGSSSSMSSSHPAGGAALKKPPPVSEHVSTNSQNTDVVVLLPDDDDNEEVDDRKQAAKPMSLQTGSLRKPPPPRYDDDGMCYCFDVVDLYDDDVKDGMTDDQDVARRLQALEWSVDPRKFLSRSTSNVAASSSSIDEQRSRSLEHAVLQQDSDFLLAQRLQKEENELASQKNTRLMEEKGMMLSTSTGKALKLVEAILAKVESFSISSSGPGPPAVGGAFTNSTSSATTTATNTTSNSNSLFEAVAKDTMVFMAERLLQLRASWKDKLMKEDKYIAMGELEIERLLKVDIGFHYTKPHNLETIRTDGLLSRSERQSQNVGQAGGGEFFGNGIYTGNNPFAFRHFGDIGLIVARLQGHVSTREDTYNLMRHDSSSSTTAVAAAAAPATLSVMPGRNGTIHNNSFNTIVGNKKFFPEAQNNSSIEAHDEVVLKTSAQVVPLVKFDMLAIQKRNPTCKRNVDKLWDMVQQLQFVIDEYCNDGHEDDTKPLNFVNRMTWADFERCGSTFQNLAGPQFTSVSIAPVAGPVSPVVMTIAAQRAQFQAGMIASTIARKQAAAALVEMSAKVHAAPRAVMPAGMNVGLNAHVPSARIVNTNRPASTAPQSSSPASTGNRCDVVWPAISRQTNNDFNDRREILAKIVEHLKLRSDFLKFLDTTKSFAEVANETEEGLYLSAKNLSDYKDVSTLPRRLMKTIDMIYRLVRPPVAHARTLQYVAPRSLEKQTSKHFVRVTKVDLKKAADDVCAICLDPLIPDGSTSNTISTRVEKLHQKLVKLPCGHFYHKGCILECTKQHGCRCPMQCSKTIGPMQGKCPSGLMTINYDYHMHCSGYPSVGTITINYHIPRTKQFKYHPNPGKNHSGATKTCYLPDNMEGNDLLRRLEYAFQHGLTFTVETSITTGRTNMTTEASDQVTWSIIHHKTGINGGLAAHGWPDKSHFDNCNNELDMLGVPSSSDLFQNVGSSI